MFILQNSTYVYKCETCGYVYQEITGGEFENCQKKEYTEYRIGVNLEDGTYEASYETATYSASHRATSTADMDENKNIIYTYTCRNCGMITRVTKQDPVGRQYYDWNAIEGEGTRREYSDDCYYVEYTFNADGEEWETGSGLQHHILTRVELMEGSVTCEDGVYRISYCLACGEETARTETYSHTTMMTALQVKTGCGILGIMARKCACGYTGGVTVPKTICTFAESSEFVDDKEIYTYTCEECGYTYTITNSVVVEGCATKTTSEYVFGEKEDGTSDFSYTLTSVQYKHDVQYFETKDESGNRVETWGCVNCDYVESVNKYDAQGRHIYSKDSNGSGWDREYNGCEYTHNYFNSKGEVTSSYSGSEHVEEGKELPDECKEYTETDENGREILVKVTAEEFYCSICYASLRKHVYTQKTDVEADVIVYEQHLESVPYAISETETGYRVTSDDVWKNGFVEYMDGRYTSYQLYYQNFDYNEDGSYSYYWAYEYAYPNAEDGDYCNYTVTYFDQNGAYDIGSGTNHVYTTYDYRLSEGSENCLDGLDEIEICLVCNMELYVWENYTSGHRQSSSTLKIYTAEELGAICGGYINVYTCPCEEAHYVDYYLDCDFDQTNWYWGYEGEETRYDYYYAEHICSVTDPDKCAFKYTYEYWYTRNENCERIEHQVWKFGVAEDGSALYTFESHYTTGDVAHDWKYEYSDEITYTEGEYTVRESSHTEYCIACGDKGYKYTHKGYQLNGVDVKYSNTYEYFHGENDTLSQKNYDEYIHVFAPYAPGYEEQGGVEGEFLSLERYEYYDVEGNLISWDQYAYAYDEYYCYPTVTWTNSNGDTSTEERGHLNSNWWSNGYIVEPTCTQYGRASHICIWCGEINEYDCEPYSHNYSYDYSKQLYVCNRCGLENFTSADGSVELEDMSAKLGNGEDYVVGYWFRKDKFDYMLSIEIVVGEELHPIYNSYQGLAWVTDDGNSLIRVNVAQVLKEVEALELGLKTCEYMVRVNIVPLEGDHEFDYAITLDAHNYVETVKTYKTECGEINFSATACTLCGDQTEKKFDGTSGCNFTLIDTIKNGYNSSGGITTGVDYSTTNVYQCETCGYVYQEITGRKTENCQAKTYIEYRLDVNLEDGTYEYVYEIEATYTASHSTSTTRETEEDGNEIRTYTCTNCGTVTKVYKYDSYGRQYYYLDALTGEGWRREFDGCNYVEYEFNASGEETESNSSVLHATVMRVELMEGSVTCEDGAWRITYCTLCGEETARNEFTSHITPLFVPVHTIETECGTINVTTRRCACGYTDTITIGTSGCSFTENYEYVNDKDVYTYTCESCGYIYTKTSYIVIEGCIEKTITEYVFGEKENSTSDFNYTTTSTAYSHNVQYSETTDENGNRVVTWGCVNCDYVQSINKYDAQGRYIYYVDSNGNGWRREYDGCKYEEWGFSSSNEWYNGSGEVHNTTDWRYELMEGSVSCEDGLYQYEACIICDWKSEYRYEFYGHVIDFSETTEEDGTRIEEHACICCGYLESMDKYNAYGRHIYSVDAEGNGWRREYDGCSYVHYEFDANKEREVESGEEHFIDWKSATDEVENRVETYYCKVCGYVESVYKYDSQERQIYYAEANGNGWRIEYDGCNYVHYNFTAEGDQDSYSGSNHFILYDISTDEEGVCTEKWYCINCDYIDRIIKNDSLGRLIYAVDGNGKGWRREYDGCSYVYYEFDATQEWGVESGEEHLIIEWRYELAEGAESCEDGVLQIGLCERCDQEVSEIYTSSHTTIWQSYSIATGCGTLYINGNTCSYCDWRDFWESSNCSFNGTYESDVWTYTCVNCGYSYTEKQSSIVDGCKVTYTYEYVFGAKEDGACDFSYTRTYMSYSHTCQSSETTDEKGNKAVTTTCILCSCVDSVQKYDSYGRTIYYEDSNGNGWRREYNGCTYEEWGFSSSSEWYNGSGGEHTTTDWRYELMEGSENCEQGVWKITYCTACNSEMSREGIYDHACYPSGPNATVTPYTTGCGIIEIRTDDCPCGQETNFIIGQNDCSFESVYEYAENVTVCTDTCVKCGYVYTRTDSVVTNEYYKYVTVEFVFGEKEDGSCDFKHTTTTVFENHPATETTLYTFEAELVNLTGKQGFGYSGSATEEGLIVSDNNANNGYCISYLYYEGAYIEFEINAETDVANAKLELRLSSEFFLNDLTMSSDVFQIIVNGTYDEKGAPLSGVVGYASFTLPKAEDSFSIAGFETYTVLENLSLKQGQNTIRLRVNNNKVAGGTASATAPVIDCIYITSDVKLTMTEYPEFVNKIPA